jgi:multiple sugar transport system permease protein
VSVALTRNWRFVALTLVPILALVSLFVYYPAISTFVSSLWSTNLRLPGAEKFVGLRNYGQLLADSEFWQVVLRSLLVVALVLPLETALGLAIALLLNENFPGRGIVRTLVILPWMLPPVVNGFLWNWLLNGEYGALNGFLYQLGLIDKYQFWLQNPTAQILWVVIVQTWTRFAFPMIVLLAALQSIPDELYEAAEIDGAGALTRLRSITLPLLRPALAIALTVEFVSTFQIFDVIWTLTAGGTAGNVINPFTKTLMVYDYQVVFRDLKIGLGSALAYLILLMSLAIGLVFVRNLYNRAVQE